MVTLTLYFGRTGEPWRETVRLSALSTRTEIREQVRELGAFAYTEHQEEDESCAG